jgi:ABC-type Fe3+-hydroxamate transport system substrate-binding protein
MYLRIRDQTGRHLSFPEQPRRIVSCVPSQTELLFDLGLEQSIVGVTKFCIHPPVARETKNIIGGTKNLNPEKIARLSPDFILANKEENDQQSIEWLASRFPTYISDVRTLDHAITMIQDVGHICGRREHASALSTAIINQFHGMPTQAVRASAAYIIWQNPWMTINEDTFIHDMLDRLGFHNAFAKRSDSRYPVITLDDLRIANPDFIFLSSEPFPFQQKHIIELKHLMPDTAISIVDGEMFSWYGSRLKQFNRDFHTITAGNADHD